MSSTAAKAAERPLDELARRLTKRSSIAKVTEGREVEPGSGEEASARRHRFADIRDTRNRRATSRERDGSRPLGRWQRRRVSYAPLAITVDGRAPGQGGRTIL